MKKTRLTLFLLSLSASCLPAKEINFPDSANWLVSFDVGAFHESRVGKFIMVKMNEEPNLKQKMEGLKNAFGVDLLKIREMSAFGSGEKDKGTALVSGGINSKQLEGFASLNDKVEIDEYQNTKTYTFKKGSLGILSKDSVVIASNEELLQEALRAKKEKQLAPLHSFVQSINKDRLPILSFAANVLKVNRLQNKIKPDQATNAKKLALNISHSLNSVMAGEVIFKKFKNMAVFMDETKDHIRVQVYFQSANNEAANHLENIFRSWPSLLALLDGVNPQLDEVMEQVRFSAVREKNNVGMTALLSHDFFESKVNEEIEKKKSAKEHSE
jgi:hypothetical protein